MPSGRFSQYPYTGKWPLSVFEGSLQDSYDWVRSYCTLLWKKGVIDCWRPKRCHLNRINKSEQKATLCIQEYHRLKLAQRTSLPLSFVNSIAKRCGLRMFVCLFSDTWHTCFSKSFWILKSVLITATRKKEKKKREKKEFPFETLSVLITSEDLGTEYPKPQVIMCKPPVTSLAPGTHNPQHALVWRGDSIYSNRFWMQRNKNVPTCLHGKHTTGLAVFGEVK